MPVISGVHFTTVEFGPFTEAGLDDQGAPKYVGGTVTFTMSRSVLNTATGQPFLPVPQVARFEKVDQGKGSIDLLSTDNPQMDNDFTWTASIVFDTAGLASRTIGGIVLPVVNETVDLELLVPITLLPSGDGGMIPVVLSYNGESGHVQSDVQVIDYTGAPPPRPPGAILVIWRGSMDPAAVIGTNVDIWIQK